MSVSHSRAEAPAAETVEPPALAAEMYWPVTTVLRAMESPLTTVPVPLSFCRVNCSQDWGAVAVKRTVLPPPLSAEPYWLLMLCSVTVSPLTSEPPLRSVRVNVSHSSAWVL
ncbi:hypothetical protein ACN28S_34675 [Cystobacter fuscus]